MGTKYNFVGTILLNDHNGEKVAGILRTKDTPEEINLEILKWENK